MTTESDINVIKQIADRAVTLGCDMTTVMMDISYCHSVTPLKLDELLAAKPMDFAHDIGGINRHLNRNDFSLNGCFRPRFAV